MRKLKFRVWSKQKSQWVENMMLLACIDGLPFAHFVEVDDNKPVKHHVYNASVLDCVIQQYTGLTDKNGKEIYEGDILMYKPSYEERLGGQCDREIFEVKFQDGCFVCDGEAASQSDASFYEVIGNIIENPELLKP